jgi:hypothetical protein
MIASLWDSYIRARASISKKYPPGANSSRHGGPNPIALDVDQHPCLVARRAWIGAIPFAWSKQMMDVIMVALGLAFFAVSVGYTIACDRL